jgi:hypothetical protein
MVITLRSIGLIEVLVAAQKPRSTSSGQRG